MVVKLRAVLSLYPLRVNIFTLSTASGAWTEVRMSLSAANIVISFGLFTAVTAVPESSSGTLPGTSRQ